MQINETGAGMDSPMLKRTDFAGDTCWKHDVKMYSKSFFSRGRKELGEGLDGVGFATRCLGPMMQRETELLGRTYSHLAVKQVNDW